MPSTHAGAVVAELWRYPVKSMAGERVESAQVTARGLHGDRVFALVDTADGKVATAKNPRKWPHLFDFAAALTTPQGVPPRVLVTLPDGTRVHGGDPGAGAVLSRALGREVRVVGAGSPAADGGDPRARSGWVARSEELAADLDGRGEEEVSDFELPEGSFADSAPVHVLTTATLTRLHELHPAGQAAGQAAGPGAGSMAVRRFRPNVLLDTGADLDGFIEDSWVGRTLRLGAEVRLAVTRPCPRCVMTTLPQAGLPKDLDVLRTAVRANGNNVGVYATVLQGGRVRRGDPAVLE